MYILEFMFFRFPVYIYIVFIHEFLIIEKVNCYAIAFLYHKYIHKYKEEYGVN